MPKSIYSSTVNMKSSREGDGSRRERPCIRYAQTVDDDEMWEHFRYI